MMMSSSPMAAGWYAVLALVCLFCGAFYWLWFVPFLQRARERLIREKLDHIKAGAQTIATISAGLSHRDPAERLATLATLQRLMRDTSNASTVATLLITFVRNHQSRRGGPEQGADDVYFALSILLSRHMRRRTRAEEFTISLSDISFDGLILRGIRLRNLDLSGASMVGTDLSNADLRGVNLSGAALRGANLSHAVLAGAVLTQADLSEANLTRVKARGANFELAKLQGADLTGAWLHRAVLRGADFFNANFTRAMIWRADFTGVDISGALLGDARALTQKQIDVTVGDANTTVPERFHFVPSSARRHRPVLEIVVSAKKGVP